MDLDKLIFTYKEAENLGGIARMSHLERVPIRDKKLMDQIRDKSTAVMYLYMKSWLSGYDEMALEYTIAEFNFETLFNK
jgi:hypothetical protein